MSVLSQRIGKDLVGPMELSTRLSVSYRQSIREWTYINLIDKERNKLLFERSFLLMGPGKVNEYLKISLLLISCARV
jgi:hypothetical protein